MSWNNDLAKDLDRCSKESLKQIASALGISWNTRTEKWRFIADIVSVVLYNSHGLV